MSDVLFQEGLRALVEERYEDAIAALELASRANNSSALFYLGQIYEDGISGSRKILRKPLRAMQMLQARGIGARRLRLVPFISTGKVCPKI